MRKYLILCSCLLAFFACKKNKDNSPSTPSTWTFAGANYTASSVTYTSSGGTVNLQASAEGNTSTSQHGLVFAFASTPNTPGQLLITNTNAPNTILAGVIVVSGSSYTFYANDSTNVYADLKINSGKISVSFPGMIWLYNSNNHSDSAQLSVGTITQD